MVGLRTLGLVVCRLVSCRLAEAGRLGCIMAEMHGASFDFVSFFFFPPFGSIRQVLQLSYKNSYTRELPETARFCVKTLHVRIVPTIWASPLRLGLLAL